jgi:hypothetical protein
VRESWAPEPTFVESSGDEIECQSFNDGRKARGFEGARQAVTKLSRYAWQVVAIRKQKGKSEGENEVPTIVSSY